MDASGHSVNVWIYHVHCVLFDKKIVRSMRANGCVNTHDERACGGVRWIRNDERPTDGRIEGCTAESTAKSWLAFVGNCTSEEQASQVARDGSFLVIMAAPKVLKKMAPNFCS